MVETKPVPSSPHSTRRVRPQTRARGAVRIKSSASRSTSAYRSSMVYPPLIMPLPDDSRRAKRPSRKFTINRMLARLMRGDSAVITTLIFCAGSICFLGTVYLAAYARVAKEERDIRALQQNLAASQARHQALVQDLASLQSGERIDTLAKQMGMIQSGHTDYVGAGVPSAPGVDQLAMAR